MTNRIAVLLILAASFAAPGVQAQIPDDGFDAADEADVLSGAIRAISRMHMEEFSDSALWEAAIDGLIESLDDPYAELFTPVESTQWEQQTTGNYSGIGLQITMLNEEVTVTAVFRNFPADQMGLSVGDVIVGVNHHDATDWDTQMAADSIRGPVGTQVRVRVRRQGYEQPLEFDITRAEVHLPAVQQGMLDNDIGYVIMDRVARDADEEMSNALDEMEDASGLIIDLRRNPGGFLEESLDLADLFLEPGSTLASTVQRRPGGEVDDPETVSYRDRRPQRVPDLPIVVLVDEFTASGAEILAGALQDYDRALVLGTRTFGKGVVQTVMQLPHGRRLRFTTGSWLTPLGRSLQRDRDAQGRPIEENLDSVPTVLTASGRTLVNGGGIFPDLEVQPDTLTLAEQNLIRVANEMEFPLGVRLQEFGFAIANERLENGNDASVTPGELDEFIASLVQEGLPTDLAEQPDVRNYLRWQGSIAVAQRMNDVGAEAGFRAERDLVLAEAIRLLSSATTQADLFEAVAAESGSPLEAAAPR